MSKELNKIGGEMAVEMLRDHPSLERMRGLEKQAFKIVTDENQLLTEALEYEIFHRKTRENSCPSEQMESCEMGEPCQCIAQAKKEVRDIADPSINGGDNQ